MKNVFPFITFLLFITSCKVKSTFRTEPVNERAPAVAVASKPIKWNLVSKMIEQYAAHPDHLLIQDPSSGYDVVFSGTRIDLNSIREIIKNPKLQDIIVYFAVKEGHIGRPYSSQYFTTVIAGIDSSNNLIKYGLDAYGNPDPTVSAVYDYCDPCPRNCPDTTK